MNLSGVIGTRREWIRDFWISMALAIWVGLLGPFGSYRATPVETRIVYYVLLSVLTTGVYGLTVRAAAAYGRKAGISAWVSVPVAVAIVSGPMSFAVAAVITTFNPRLKTVVSPLDWYLQTLAIMLPVGFAYLGVSYFLSRRTVRPEAAPPATQPDVQQRPQPASPPRLLARLPMPVRSDVLALQAEDHYVRVHTQLGSELLLMRFSDAISELDGLAGMRVHRSWWVADDAIVDTVRRARRTIHVLSNSIEVPVSRPVAAAKNLRSE